MVIDEQSALPLAQFGEDHRWAVVHGDKAHLRSQPLQPGPHQFRHLLQAHVLSGDAGLAAEFLEFFDKAISIILDIRIKLLHVFSLLLFSTMGELILPELGSFSISQVYFILRASYTKCHNEVLQISSVMSRHLKSFG